VSLRFAVSVNDVMVQYYLRNRIGYELYTVPLIYCW